MAIFIGRLCEEIGVSKCVLGIKFLFVVLKFEGVIV